METGSVERRPVLPWLSVFAAAFWLVALGGVIIAAWAGIVWLEKAGIVASLRERGGVGPAVALVFVHAAVAVSPAPGETVALANSTIYGFGWGVVMNWCGWMIGAIVEFFLLRRAIQSLPSDTARWTPGWMRRLPGDHPLFLIAGRWIPCGGHVVNAAAAARATFPRHCWTAALGILPVAVLFSALANGWKLLW